LTPTSSTPATATSTPPSTADADATIPSSATEQNAEVAEIRHLCCSFNFYF
jgi:hypothetical protein